MIEPPNPDDYEYAGFRYYAGYGPGGAVVDMWPHEGQHPAAGRDRNRRGALSAFSFDRTAATLAKAKIPESREPKRLVAEVRTPEGFEPIWRWGGFKVKMRGVKALRQEAEMAKSAVTGKSVEAPK